MQKFQKHAIVMMALGAAGGGHGRGEYGRKEENRDRQQQQDGALAELARELKSKTDEVKDLGRQVLAAKEAGESASLELKGKVDEALTAQGEIKQQMLELQQTVAKGLKSNGDDATDTLEMALKSHFEENAHDAALLARPQLGKSVNIQMSRKAMLGSTATGAALNYPGTQLPMVAPLVRRLTIRDLMPQGRTDSPVVFYPREAGFTGGPAIVAEGALKPEWNVTIENITATVPTIAHWTQISLQMLSDVSFIRSYIEGRMLYQLKLVEENQFLNGSGAGGNMEGIYTSATAYAEPAGVEVANETAIDRLRLMMLQVELANAFATGIVLHPVDWANIELLKDGEQRYLFTNPQNTATGRVWGRDVVSTQAMTAGNALVGDFATHAQVLDREDANVAISFEDRDNFIKNLATIRVEERALVLNYRPEAFVKGSLVIA